MHTTWPLMLSRIAEAYHDMKVEVYHTVCICLYRKLISTILLL